MYSLPEKTVYVKRLLIHFSFGKFSCGLCVVDIWLLVVNVYSSSRLDVTGFGLPLELSGISDLFAVWAIGLVMSDYVPVPQPSWMLLYNASLGILTNCLTHKEIHACKHTHIHAHAQRYTRL